MAQILKEEVRVRIENAAINQLIKNGMHKTNMRDIAKEAGITPGNLYRYYASKDQLIISITSPIVDGLNRVVLSETDGKLNLDSKVPILPIPPDNIDALTYMENLLLTKLRNSLLEIGRITIEYPKRMIILLDDSIVSKKLYAWGIAIMNEGFHTCFKINKATDKQIDIMLKVIAMSFCEGIIQLLKAVIEDEDELQYEKMIDRFLLIQTAGIAALLKQELSLKTIMTSF